MISSGKDSALMQVRKLLQPILTALVMVWILGGCNPRVLEFQDLGIGGDFRLETSGNENWKLSENLKDINLLFFGYTACPDYCPMTLSKFKKLNELLGEKKSRVQYIFISLDDKRDNPDNLKKYVDFYVDNGVGLTGNRAEVSEVLSQYKGTFLWNGDSIDHSTYTYLVDKDLKTRYLFKHADTPEEIHSILKILLR